MASNRTNYYVLIVEDNPGDRDLILEYLDYPGTPFDAQTAASLNEAIKNIESKKCDIVLLDLALPDSVGLDTLKTLKNRAPEIPIIVFTGLEDEQVGIRSIRIGAQDYLVKGQVNSDLLLRSLRHAIERHSLELKVNHYNKVLRAIRNINRLIVREKDAKKLIKEACGILLKTRGYRGAWMALGTYNEPASYVSQAGWGDLFTSMENDLYRGYWPPCVGKLLESDETILVQTSNKNCRCSLSKDHFHDMGGVCILRHGDKIFGVLAVSFPTGFNVDESEESLLLEISHDISFGLHNIDSIKRQKEAEDRIQNQHRFLQLLMDAIPISVFYKDTQGKYIGCNTAYSDFIGKPKEQVIGKNVYELHPKDLAERYHEMDLDVSLNSGIHQYEASVRRNDGVRREMLINKATYHDNQGNFAGIIGTMTDITDRKEIEKRLRQSQKMEAIGTLAGGIAHDFNNILSSILGFTQLSLELSEKGSFMEDNLQEVYNAGMRAKELVKQILAFARRSEEKIHPVQPFVIVKEVLKFIRSSIPSTIEINQNLESKAFIMGNATQIYQVIMNLCTNAAQAMEEKGGRLTVTLKDIVSDACSKLHHLNLEHGNYLELMVKDTGSGIEPSIIDSIFEPYFTTKEPGEGTGMGLAMVHGIVDSCDGAINVDSTAGEGTTFYVYLPISNKERPVPMYEPGTLPSGNERIMFVDDEPPIAKMGGRVLKGLGYSVTTKTSSVEALELFRSRPDEFDLVITDMTMPGITGDKLAVELLKIRPEIPIIICTGFSRKISDLTAKNIGIKALVYKPIDKSETAKTVRKVLDEVKHTDKNSSSDRKSNG